MRHIFLVNPKAGKGRAAKEFVPAVHAYFKQHGRDPYGVVMIESAEQAEQTARKYAAAGGEVRLYACGGDGTADSVLNGMQGYPNAALGFVPFGTANDFIRTFGSAEDFQNIDAQVRGEEWEIDLIRCADRYALNQCSMGMDADVCAHKDRFSALPLISGQPAYVLSLLYCLCSPIKHHLWVTVDGETFEGDFLFAVAANGRFCGGGFQSAPGASVTDGMLDCLMVRAVSRANVLRLMPRYAQGTHLTLPVCKLLRGRSMTICSASETAVNQDGEVHFAQRAVFTAVPKGVKFIVPGPCREKIKEKKRRASARRAAALAAPAQTAAHAERQG